MGAGHFYRQLALAQEASRRGISTALIMYKAPTRIRATAEKAGIEVIEIEESSNSPEDPTPIHRVAIEKSVKVVVIDGYHFPEALYEALSPDLRVVAVDDIAHQKYFVDVLVNVNPGAHRLAYRTRSNTLRLFGPRYVLLRRQFMEVAPRTVHATNAQRILVTMGGGDGTRETLIALAGIQLAGFTGQVDVMAGPSSEHFHEIRRHVKCRSTWRLLRNVDNMASLMASQDMAICAGGGTTWELCLLGIPIIQWSVADNQKANVDELAHLGITESLGHARTVTAERIAEAVRRLVNNPVRRTAMAIAGRALVDGHGVRRVMDALMQKGKNK